MTLVAYSKAGRVLGVVADTNLDGIADFRIEVSGTTALSAGDFVL